MQERMSGPRIGCFSPFVPREWIAAHGAIPETLSPEALSFETLSSSFSSRRGVCSCAGDLLDRLLSDTSFDGIVLPTTCDQLRYSAALLQTRLSTPLFLLNVPSTWESQASRSYYADELRRLGRFLEERCEGTRQPSPAMLADVMRRYDASRAADRKLTEEETRHRDAEDNAIRLALVGGPWFATERTAMVQRFKELGARLVLDASEFGERTMPDVFDPIAMESDPFDELVRAYFDVIPDAFRRPNTMLYDWLERRFAERGVQGVLIRRHVFCDLWNGEASRIREHFGLPTLDLHVGQGEDAAASRTWGRIEAFLECLEH